MAFIAGKNCPATWSTDGSVYTTLDIVGHDWEEAIDKLDVTSTGHSGVQALIAGILRGTGNVRLKYKSTVLPPSTLSIYAGKTGFMRFFVTSTTYYQVPGIITKVNYKSEVNGAVEYGVTIELSAETGTYTQLIN